MNIWAGLALALLLAGAGKFCYDAGSASRDQEIADANGKTASETAKVEKLQLALDEQSAKVMQFAKDQAAAEEKRKELRAQALAEGAAEEARVKAAEAVTTNAGDVLRANWGADE